jgi:hypothetical protein
MTCAIEHYPGAVAILDAGQAEPWVVLTDGFACGLVGPSHRPIAWITSSGDGYTVLLLDVAKRRTIGKVEFATHPHDTPAISADGKHLYWVNEADTGWSVKVVDTETGNVRDHVIKGATGKKARKGTYYKRGPMTLLADGRLRVLTTTVSAGHPVHARMLTIDPVTGKHEHVDLPALANSFSPSGKYMLLETRQAGDVVRKQRDVRRLFSLDLWACEPQRLVKTLACLSLTAQVPKKSKNPWLNLVDHIDEFLVRGLFEASIDWQPDETAFWVEKRGFLACVGLDGTRSPALWSERQRLDTVSVGGVPTAHGLSRFEALAGRRAKLVIGHCEIEVDGAPRLDVLEPQQVSSTQDRCHHLPRSDQAFRKRVEKLIEADRDAKSAPASNNEPLDAICAIAGREPAQIAEGIEALAQRIEARGAANPFSGNDLMLAFDVAGKLTPEAAFFKKLAADNMTSIVPALRRLMAAYLPNAGGWCDADEGLATFVHPMRALLLLDPVNSRDLFLRYISGLDDEHARATWHLIFSPFVNKYGLTSKEDVRLAVKVVMHELNAGHDEGVWKQYTLLASAQKLMTGDAFAVIVLAELPNLLGIDKADEGDLVDEDDDVIDIYIGPLLVDVPAKTAFGTALRARLGQRWSNIKEIERAYRENNTL